ncbi:uncharacterized protein M421DRAFT_6374 [Didymella exigua CBS 183.55]|uniref:Uncharacterized protein n=1 Tax=Didymella exigua CBS 183.55 TaxID=1150837 RepID=A0A6A5RIV3_9PLEO|nr:uncharacterized protein M421DRAFT_6374 [Didymella exigua CBS 183.55]KAF1927180.1 hypothetical protein M421DRAFT_6374 [Didymella exigua CBS 183.55]
MASHNDIKASANSGFPDTSGAPREQFEQRQTANSEDHEPNPAKSISLSPARQALVGDVREPNSQVYQCLLTDTIPWIIALYSCQPTVQRVKRYTSDCVYDDQFGYANDRWKMAG